MYKRMDLKIDFAFKQIFGKSGNEHILISFLNAVLQLPPGEQITSVQFLNPELPREHPDDKSSLLDIHVKTEKNIHINVEIQLANRYDMENRTLFYWARIFSLQLKKAMNYLQLTKTITINILDFRFLAATERFHTTFHLYEDQEQFPLTDLLEIHFLEIPKVMDKWRQQAISPHDDALARWLLLLEAHEHEDIWKTLEVLAMQDPVMDDLFEQWYDMNFDEKKWFQYESRRKAILDEFSTQQYLKEFKQEAELAKQEAEQAKQEKKVAEEQGERKGEKKGREEGILQVAKKLLQMSMTPELIAESTGLSMEQIHQLQKG